MSNHNTLMEIRVGKCSKSINLGQSLGFLRVGKLYTFLLNEIAYMRFKLKITTIHNRLLANADLVS